MSYLPPAKVTKADIQNIGLSLARTSFYAYCRMRMPRFYTKDKTYLKELCDTLQAFYEDRLYDEKGAPIQRLMINLPPRHGKTLTLVLLAQWIYGHDVLASIIDIAYNETLSGRFAKYVRDGMQEEKANDDTLVYSDYFPKTKIKKGDGAYQLWAIEGSHFSFLATSPGGTLTGNGCLIGIIDDIIKNAKESYNDTITEGHYDWYANTFLSRLENGAKQLMIMHRWGTKDLCGRILKHEGELWHVIKMRANRNYPDLPRGPEDMLCNSVLSYETYINRKNKTDPVIFDSNYDQEPYALVDALYGKFKEYLPGAIPQGGVVHSYTDTADEGEDFLAHFVYCVLDGVAYILDVVYTQDPMEVTENEVVRSTNDHQPEVAFIESNNGGRGFARNVERLCRAQGNLVTSFDWFHQSENKRARILSNATSVVNGIVFPAGWQARWPKLYADLRSMSRVSKWAHDDAADALTGIVEKSLSVDNYVLY